MLLCFIVILFICVVVGVIKYSTAHSLKQEKDIKLSTIDNEKFTMVWGIERSGFFNGREKWAKGFENQRV